MEHGTSGEARQQKADLVTIKTREEAKEHNDRLTATGSAGAIPQKGSCAQCGTNPVPGASKFSKCAGCHAVHYCSSACQKTAWKEGHKRVCKSRKAKPKLSIVDQWLEMKPYPQWLTCRREEVRVVMRKLGVGAEHLAGLKVGDWHGAHDRLEQSMKKVNVRNTPPLRAGDRIEVQAGNHLKWPSVGMRGTLEEYFPDTAKWGIQMDDGEPVCIMAANLKRV
jgi:hypothetical protein